MKLVAFFIYFFKFCIVRTCFYEKNPSLTAIIKPNLLINLKETPNLFFRACPFIGYNEKVKPTRLLEPTLLLVS